MSEVCSIYARYEECILFHWQLLNGKEDLGVPGRKTRLELEIKVC